MRRIPPVPVPQGEKYCFMCERCMSEAAFYHRNGKACSPCKACTRKRPDRREAWNRVMENAIREVQEVLARRAPEPPPVTPTYQVNDRFVRWLAQREADAA